MCVELYMTGNAGMIESYRDLRRSFLLPVYSYSHWPQSPFLSQRKCVISIALYWRTRLFFTCLTDGPTVPVPPFSPEVLVISSIACSLKLAPFESSCAVFLDRELCMVMYVKTSCHCHVKQQEALADTTLAGSLQQHYALTGS